MALYRSDALVLRRRNLGEADRIVTFLSRERGKMRAVARSARRVKSKFAGAMEPLTHVHLEFYGKENADQHRDDHRIAQYCQQQFLSAAVAAVLAIPAYNADRNQVGQWRYSSHDDREYG